MTKWRAWWHSHEGWIAALMLAIGAFAFGYMTASFHYSREFANQRAHYSKELAEVSSSYAAAMAAKDALIGALTIKTTKAATTADRAAAKARKAVEQAQTKHPKLKRWTK